MILGLLFFSLQLQADYKWGKSPEELAQKDKASQEQMEAKKRKQERQQKGSGFKWKNNEERIRAEENQKENNKAEGSINQYPPKEWQAEQATQGKLPDRNNMDPASIAPIKRQDYEGQK